MAAANFSLKISLDEANDVREALQEKLDKAMERPAAEWTDDERAQAGRIETLLRRDFS